MFRNPLLPGLASLFWGSVATVAASSVPVFRYALDRWEADPLVLQVPQSVAERSPAKDLLRSLRADGVANLKLVPGSGTQSSLWSAPAGDQQLWKGRLTVESLTRLIDSPARQRLAETLLNGSSLVWIVVEPEGGTEIQRITDRLRALEQTFTLPPLDPDDPDTQPGPGPELRLDLDVLSIRSDDPEESIFLRMLAGPEFPASIAREGFAAVMFGRGRVLGAWPLSELDDRVLEDRSLFLIDPCSTPEKSANPGWDVIMDVDWDEELKRMEISATAGREPGGARKVMAVDPPQAGNPPEEVIARAEPVDPAALSSGNDQGDPEPAPEDRAGTSSSEQSEKPVATAEPEQPSPDPTPSPDPQSTPIPPAKTAADSILSELPPLTAQQWSYLAIGLGSLLLLGAGWSKASSRKRVRAEEAAARRAANEPRFSTGPINPIARSAVDATPSLTSPVPSPTPVLPPPAAPTPSDTAPRPPSRDRSLDITLPVPSRMTSSPLPQSTRPSPDRDPTHLTPYPAEVPVTPVPSIPDLDQSPFTFNGHHGNSPNGNGVKESEESSR